MTLLRSGWATTNREELYFILREYLGGPGQYDGKSTSPNVFYLPLAGTEAAVCLTFREREIVRIDPGPAFDPAVWSQVVDEIERPVAIGFGREYAFCSRRVRGSWHGARSQVVILPPPDDAPTPAYEMAQHPFILEFPVNTGRRWPITNFRRIRAHRLLSSVLNLLLRGRVTILPKQSRHFWGIDPSRPLPQRSEWLQEFYTGRLGKAVLPQGAPPSEPPLREVKAGVYYRDFGDDGSGLGVPDDLDDLLCRYQALSPEHAAKLERAAFWIRTAAEQWTISASSTFASLAIAVEALGKPPGGAAARFRAFLEKYAPSASLKKQRHEMYRLRSEILHGSQLLDLDRDALLGWAPPELADGELLEKLGGLVGIAVRNWLRKPT